MLYGVFADDCIHSFVPLMSESHVKLLKERNQAVPQSIALLLADARRKEERTKAKRVANRKSACSSRARKKALVEEMTKANAWLRRQAMILSLLPDLVIAITVDGKITFCSAQVRYVTFFYDVVFNALPSPCPICLLRLRKTGGKGVATQDWSLGWCEL